MRNKIKATLVAIVAALAMLVGGLATSAPAQAVVGSSIKYIERSSSVPTSWRVVATNTNGVTQRLALNGGMTNVFRACPSDLGGKIRYRHPNGTLVTLDYGQCFSPSAQGLYTIIAVG